MVNNYSNYSWNDFHSYFINAFDTFCLRLLSYWSSFSLYLSSTCPKCFRKLHCARNKLHMNLFASFIFRAFIKLLKDLVFVNGVGFSDTVRYKDGETFFFEDTEVRTIA